MLRKRTVRRTSPPCPRVNTAETIWLWIMNICGILVSRELYETCTRACHTPDRCLTIFLHVTKRKFELESDIKNKMKDERRGWRKPTARGIPYFTYIDPVGCLRGAAVLLNIDRGTVQSPRVVGSWGNSFCRVVRSDTRGSARCDRLLWTTCDTGHFSYIPRARVATTFHFKCTRDTRWLVQIYIYEQGLLQLLQ